MTDTAASGAARPAASTDPAVWVGLAAAIVFFLASGGVAWFNVQTLRDDTQLVVHTHEALTALGDLLSILKDAESGQRGFLLTGNDSYLQPYDVALQEVGDRLDRVKQITSDNPRQQERLVALKRHIDAKLDELRETIDLRRTQGPDSALAIVRTSGC